MLYRPTHSKETVVKEVSCRLGSYFKPFLDRVVEGNNDKYKVVTAIPKSASLSAWGNIQEFSALTLESSRFRCNSALQGQPF